MPDDPGESCANCLHWRDLGTRIGGIEIGVCLNGPPITAIHLQIAPFDQLRWPTCFATEVCGNWWGGRLGQRQ